MIVESSDQELYHLKQELANLEIKLQLLYEEKNECLRDIEDFNLQYTLYLGELIENILRLKKDLLLKKTRKKKHLFNKDNYEDTKETIHQIENTLKDLKNTLDSLSNSDPKYIEILKIYKELEDELVRLNEEANEVEEDFFVFDNCDDIYTDYTSSKNEYEEYYKNNRNIKENDENSVSLNDTEKVELKNLWKKACKLCHPDIVTEQFKDKAHELMQLLNDAYSKKDIDKIKAILVDLENGVAFSMESDAINEASLLKTKILEYQEKVFKLEIEIDKIKNDTTFQVIIEQKNWSEYFQKIKLNLENEKENLEYEIVKLLKNQKEKFDLYIFSNNIKNIKNRRELESYLESCFFELENFFDAKNLEDIKELEFDLVAILGDIKAKTHTNQKTSLIVNAFYILLAQQFEKIKYIDGMKLILEFLPDCGIKKRIKALLLYLNVKELPKAYFDNFNEIISLIFESINDDENNAVANISILNYYITAYNYFIKTNDEDSLKQFEKLFIGIHSKYASNLVSDLLYNQSLHDSIIDTEDYELINQFLLEEKKSDQICNLIVESKSLKEDSEYSQILYSLDSPTFDDVKQIASSYISSIGNPDELFYQLNRGQKVIDDEKLLFKYLQSFGSKHKAKLYSAYDQIFEKIKGKQLNIIDWGCGQALATMVLLDYAKTKKQILDISNIILIEPSMLALSRGLLHIDVFKQKEYNIKSINSEIDCLQDSDILIENDYYTLHLFANILDIEHFRINDLLHKISSNISNDNLFVCVSPKINDKRSNRLDLFYKYFDENFNTELISSRDSDIENSTRYEKIFEVQYTNNEIVEEMRQDIITIQQSFQFDIFEALQGYSDYVIPILDMKILEDSINSDPEYAIYKIRKVAEVVTSKIYSKYEENSSSISFNDKIRYLAYEKKVFDKMITNYVHTIRTIGNSGVHEENRDITKLNVDAHLMIIALVGFFNELSDKKLLI